MGEMVSQVGAEREWENFAWNTELSLRRSVGIPYTSALDVSSGLSFSADSFSRIKLELMGGEESSRYLETQENSARGEARFSYEAKMGMFRLGGGVLFNLNSGDGVEDGYFYEFSGRHVGPLLYARWANARYYLNAGINAYLDPENNFEVQRTRYRVRNEYNIYRELMAKVSVDVNKREDRDRTETTGILSVGFPTTKKAYLDFGAAAMTEDFKHFSPGGFIGLTFYFGENKEEYARTQTNFGKTEEPR